jgi:hypothetical protein
VVHDIVRRLKEGLLTVRTNLIAEFTICFQNYPQPTFWNAQI